MPVAPGSGTTSAPQSPTEAPANPSRGDRHDVFTRTQGGVLLHVYEELAQHLGQLEVTRDVLLSRSA